MMLPSTTRRALSWRWFNRSTRFGSRYRVTKLIRLGLYRLATRAVQQEHLPAVLKAMKIFTTPAEKFPVGGMKVIG